MRILIVGATGMVGQSLLRECLLAEDISEVAVLVRSPMNRQHAKLKQLVAADLFTADEVLHAVRDYDACFYCLGVASSGMTEDEYRRITQDLTLATAEQLPANNPAMRFIYISGSGADSSEQGKTMWVWVRGATENVLQRLPFAGVYCFRPAVVVPKHGVQSKTASYRWFYRLASPVLPLLQKLPSVITSEQLGQAMLNATRFGGDKAVLEAADIKRLRKNEQNQSATYFLVNLAGNEHDTACPAATSPPRSCACW
ncbi:NAD(P)H-binding protein [Neisseria subflava]|uniref:NAD(P)H-binding protein n=1 Tax=Neisseria subflava TaxID=28449 RepID=UPI0020B71455|nr:NAD(P)H-binding protein [Neisseria subflava]UTG67851.1 NAD(P)H-binding protein [Neisseria subflava]